MFKWAPFFQKPRLLKYWLLSTNKNVIGKAECFQPVLLIGVGKISFGKNVQLGYYPSPLYYSGYIHLESRNKDAIIEIGNNVRINNNFIAVSEFAGIYIGDNVLIGVNCEIIDSDFHELIKEKRNGGIPVSKKSGNRR
ncbi:MAG: hypothetical protein WDO71_25235 [Bacteroidota bacterium]